MTSPDENATALPDSWRRKLHPRRGGAPVRPVKVKSSVVAAMTARVAAGRPLCEMAFTARGSDPLLVEEGRRHLEGEAGPLGAAVVAATALPELDFGVLHEKDGCALVDTWIVEHGIGFAARAFVEMSEVTVRWAIRDSARVPGWVRGRNDPWPWPFAGMEYAVGRRLRTLLATCDEPEYRAAVEALAEARRTPRQRLVAAYLVPARSDWVAESCREAARSDVGSRFEWMYGCAVAGEHLDLIDPLDSWMAGPVEFTATLVDGAGAALAPTAARAADSGHGDGRAGGLDVLAMLPSDAAFRSLLDRLDQEGAEAALVTAMARFPRRAMRVLAEPGSSRAARLLAAHVRARPALAADGLPAEVRAVVEADARVPEAPAGDLPRALADPPWARPAGSAKRPVVIGGLEPVGEPAVRWAAGEREAWARQESEIALWDEDSDWDELARRFRLGDLKPWGERSLLVQGPEDLVRPLVPDWESPLVGDVHGWMRPVLARWELAALPAAQGLAEAAPARAGDLLLPFLDADVALQTAEWLARSKTGGRVARAWIERHGVEAVPLLVPAAMGKTGAARRGAEAALRLVAESRGEEAVVRAARPFGNEVVEAVQRLLATDPLEVYPAKVPAPVDVLIPHLLPQVLLRGRERALPASAVGHLLTMLEMSGPEERYAGLAAVREICDPASLAEFGWALFERWRDEGMPPGGTWALTQLGWSGDDGTVRRLSPLLRAWPGEGGHARTVTGLDVLAEIGTDFALANLNGFAERASSAKLRERARERIERVADGLGLSPERLADRLVPGLGLDDGASLVLDYGPRRFTVGFDERLRPYVTDADGNRRKDLPKPGARDDQAMAEAAYRPGSRN
ncbi:hypothetical protein GCM10010191_86380 [Actinomadura vinacea]|uniref:DUF4132 domain-containing protein n=1 Tax=Actinomadura vinacea TaxID=115336 RepID=A0ABP5XM24_9ACTN